MIDHVGLHVMSAERGRHFYEKALLPLGMVVVAERRTSCSFGKDGWPTFWINEGAQGRAAGPAHVAFLAPDRQAVDEFYTAALAAGGRDNGPPGVRPGYHPAYYSAFVLDLDGHNIEAVCHRPE